LLAVQSIAAGANVLLLFEAVRLREFRLYASAQNSGSAGFNAVGMEFTPNFSSATVVPGIDTTRTNTATTSTAGSVYLIKKPPKDSIAHSWLNPQGVPANLPLMVGIAPVGSVLDFVLDVVITDGSNPVVKTVVTGAATAGVFCYIPAASLSPQDFGSYT